MKDTNLELVKCNESKVEYELTEQAEVDDLYCDQLDCRIKMCNEVTTLVKLVANLVVR